MKRMEALCLAPEEASYDPMRDMIEYAFVKNAIKLVSIDESFKSSPISANAMTNAIQDADLIVADLSYLNPNILFELGFAYAFGKPTLLLLSTDAAGVMPSDLAGHHMLIYDPKNLSPLTPQLSQFL